MKLLSKFGGYFGYIIGIVFFLPILLLLINKFYINTNDAKKVIKSYAENSTEVKVKMPDIFLDRYNLALDLYDVKVYTIAFATKNMGRDGSTKLKMYFKVIYSKVNKKYFVITMMDLHGKFWGALNNANIIMRVNKSDLADPTYGTKNRPILVFGVRGADGPLMDRDINGVYSNYDTSQEQYEYNVFMYFTYVMSKREFDERFMNGK